MMNSYEIKDGVIYIRDFRQPPDYFRENGFAGIRKAVFADDISVIPRCSMQLLKELREIVWPKGLKAIGEGCFSDCSSLTELKLPEGLETIGESAFQNAENVKYVHIPRSVREIGRGAFYFGDGGHILSFRVHPENPAYCDLDGVLYTKDRSALIRYPSARRRAEYTVPDTVTRICDGAFAHSHICTAFSSPTDSGSWNNTL